MPRGSGDHGLPGPYFNQPETLGAVFVSLLDLGVNPGQTFFGYSLFAADVGPGPHDLLDPATFPQNTAGGSGGGSDFYGGVSGYFMATPFSNPQLGMAKQASVTGNLVTITHRIENFGNTRLNNLSLIDDLDATFGAGNYLVGTPTLMTPPATSVLSLNLGYTGAPGPTAELLDVATSILEVGKFALIEVPVTMTTITDRGNGVGVFFNTAVGAGDPPSGAADRITDASTDGVDPDADGNDSDGTVDGDRLPDENTPTPIIVTAQNQPPIAIIDRATTPLDTPVTLSVVANDTEIDGTIDPATVDLNPNVPERQEVFTVPEQGLFTTDDAGNVLFTPVEGFIGTSTIPYTVQDNLGALSNIAAIIVTVTTTGTPNQPPLAVDDLATTQMAIPVTLAVTANDTDTDGTLNLATVDLEPDTSGRQTTLTVPSQGTFVADNAGNVTFAPAESFIGASTIAYTVQDDQGATSNPAAITVTVLAPPNQPPVAVSDGAITPLDAPVTLAITTNDIDPDGTVDTATVDLDPSAPGRQTTMRVSAQGRFDADEVGQAMFTPETGFTGISTIAYTVMDEQAALSNLASISVLVIAPEGEQPPLAVPDRVITPLNTPVTLPVTENGIDIDGTIDTATVDLDPSTPGRQTSISVPAQGIFIADEAGNVTFTPELGFTRIRIHRHLYHCLYRTG